MAISIQATDRILLSLEEGKTPRVTGVGPCETATRATCLSSPSAPITR
jgi:hypothetical protein